jgi:dihydrolipoamide dehydrogenase
VRRRGRRGQGHARAKNILIASGSDVTPLPGCRVDEKKIVSSTGALELTEVPKRLVVVGAGIIGSSSARCGAARRGGDGDRVPRPHHARRRRRDHQALPARARRAGHEVQARQQGHQGRRVGLACTLTVEPAKGGAAETVEADVVLVCIGRRPYVDGLGLDKAGVKLTARGRIEVDAHFQTSVPGIYAIGDVIDGPMLAHKASEDGVACVETLAGRRVT